MVISFWLIWMWVINTSMHICYTDTYVDLYYIFLENNILALWKEIKCEPQSTVTFINVRLMVIIMSLVSSIISCWPNWYWSLRENVKILAPSVPYLQQSWDLHGVLYDGYLLGNLCRISDTLPLFLWWIYEWVKPYHVSYMDIQHDV